MTGTALVRVGRPPLPDDRCALKTLRYKLHLARCANQVLVNRLRAIKRCEDRRCSLCGACLNAAWGEDDSIDT